MGDWSYETVLHKNTTVQMARSRFGLELNRLRAFLRRHKTNIFSKHLQKRVVITNGVVIYGQIRIKYIFYYKSKNSA